MKTFSENNNLTNELSENALDIIKARFKQANLLTKSFLAFLAILLFPLALLLVALVAIVTFNAIAAVCITFFGIAHPLSPLMPGLLLLGLIRVFQHKAASRMM